MSDEELLKSLNEGHERTIRLVPKMLATGEAHEWLPQGVTARYRIEGILTKHYLGGVYVDDGKDQPEFPEWAEKGAYISKRVRVTVEVLE